MSTNHRGWGMWSGYLAKNRGIPTYQNYPDAPHFFDLLTKAKDHPDKHSVPICHLHVEGMAQSISKREMSDMVLVLVEPGRRDPDLFSCFLCCKEEAQVLT